MVGFETILISSFIGTIAILFIIALLIYIFAFGKRINPNPSFKYFDIDDFSLNAEPIEIINEGDDFILRGNIYNKGNCDKGVVIFCHGLGPGQIAYLSEINYLCDQCFTVLAIDNVGCNISGGKNIKGMYCGIKAAISGFNYIKLHERFNGMKIHLVGHSLGGYSALCASSKIDCDKVVSISAPLTPASSLYCGASIYINRYLAYILQPFWYLIDFLHFGFKGNMNSSKCALKSRAKKLLIIHGELDTNVPLKYSAYGKLSEDSKIKKYLAKNKYHDPYITANAQKLRNELRNKITQSIKNGSWIDNDYFDSFDFKAADEEDEEVMKTISDFLYS